LLEVFFLVIYSNMLDVYGVYGGGGFSREVLPLVSRAYSGSSSKIYNIVDEEFMPECNLTNGYPVVSFQKFLEIPSKNHLVTIALSNGQLRKKIHVECINASTPLFQVEAPNVFKMDNVEIGDGAILSPFVTITSNAKIGRCFHANIYSYVAHDCIVGDYVTFAPAVKCNGNVVIEDYAYLGTGAIIKPGTSENPIIIGRGAVVGAGSFVTKSVAPGTVVVGSPARLLIK